MIYHSKPVVLSRRKRRTYTRELSGFISTSMPKSWSRTLQLYIHERKSSENKIANKQVHPNAQRIPPNYGMSVELATRLYLDHALILECGDKINGSD